MRQYSEIKEQYPDTILFFRLGDFYEMFGEDAVTASKVLQIALTTRDKGKEDPTPMCGIPYFTADTYIGKLIKAGHRVAICEQVEDPKEAKVIVKREVVRVITPGTYFPEDSRENAYIASCYPKDNIYGIAVADLSTGEFFLYETPGPLDDELARFEPREVIYPMSMKLNSSFTEPLSSYYLTAYDDWYFDYLEAYRALLKQFKVASLEGYGCEGMIVAISSAGALINYLSENQKDNLSFKRIRPLQQSSYMFLDAQTQRNLEITKNLRDGSRDGSLLGVMDETLTPMGGRLLRAWLTNPLLDLNEISARQEAVATLKDDYMLLEEIRFPLRGIYDIERLASRIELGSANARDVVSLKTSLKAIPSLKKALTEKDNPRLRRICDNLHDFSGIVSLIDKAIVNNPPIGLRDGGIIRDGFNAEIDDLRKLSSSGKDFIASIELKERQKTGINSLKVGYNRIFGYYIEITKANLEQVPADYIRKQTLVNAERFITPELKEYETRVIGAEERLKTLEYDVFQDVIETVIREAEAIHITASAVAELDVICSLAIIAKKYRYERPVLYDGADIWIAEGRHPVLERLELGERFIPNDTLLDDENRMLIITGPNMAGKSTYMRQTALIVLMAQIGSFVPASDARIGIVDRIFTRIGASDIITKGQSTFMVEMIETANILNNATEKSLIILDEVGRGTSTFDGISIAWAVAEYIAKRINARTLFATHYNELTELGIIIDGVKNLNVVVREWGDEVIFLRKIENGPADKSYGIQVAKLAGIPDDVISRAKEVLSNLEKTELNEIGVPKIAYTPGQTKAERQLDLFTTQADPLITELLGLDVAQMTPLEALNKLNEMKKRIGWVKKRGIA